MAPRKIESHDKQLKERLNKIGAVMPATLARARKYRSSSNWQTVRALKLADTPLCQDPFKDHSDIGTSVPGTQVHHIRGLATHFSLRAYEPNLASICTSCHSKIESMERQNKPTHYLFRI